MNFSNIPKVQANLGDSEPAGAYERQHYFNEQQGNFLAACVSKYIASGRTSLSWNISTFNGKPTTLKLMLNCAKAWILKHPQDYPPDVVQTLLTGTIAKRNGYYVLVEGDHVTAKHPADQTTSLMQIAEVGSYDSPEPIPVTDITQPSVLKNTPIKGGPEPAASQHMAYLPDDGDIASLLFNLESFAATAPARSLFHRSNIKLSPTEIAEVKTKAAALGLIGRVEATQIRVAKP